MEEVARKVSHFSNNTDAVATGIERLAWPKATALTSTALGAVEQELAVGGRKGVQKVVVVFSDGKALGVRRTLKAALALRKRARVIFVAVTKKARLRNIKKWASKPLADNVVFFRHLRRLTEPSGLNKVMADACPIVE